MSSQDNNSENKSLMIVIIVGLIILLLLYHYWKNCHTNKNEPMANVNSKKVEVEIYHMVGCPHCEDIVKNKQSNGKTKLDELKDIFKSNKNVKISTFEYGKDKKADKFNAFPVILINGDSYDGARDVQTIVKSIKSKF